MNYMDAWWTGNPLGKRKRIISLFTTLTGKARTIGLAQMMHPYCAKKRWHLLSMFMMENAETSELIYPALETSENKNDKHWC